MLSLPQRTDHNHETTDSQLQLDVMAELKWEPAVHAAQNGVVTLAGEVGSCTEKLIAERATQRVDGVKAVAVEMKVTLPQLGKRTDADIADVG
jgi:osmotically-inducible protein OsmY